MASYEAGLPRKGGRKKQQPIAYDASPFQQADDDVIIEEVIDYELPHARSRNRGKKNNVKDKFKEGRITPDDKSAFKNVQVFVDILGRAEGDDGKQYQSYSAMLHRQHADSGYLQDFPPAHRGQHRGQGHHHPNHMAVPNLYHSPRGHPSSQHYGHSSMGHGPRGQGRRGQGHRGQGHHGPNPNGINQENMTRQKSQQGEKGKLGKKVKHQNRAKITFESYWSMEEVQQGLKRGQLIQGRIRINPKNYEDSYVAHPDGQSDIYISGMTGRNRALEGDIVVVQLMERKYWKVLTDEVETEEQQLAEHLRSLDLRSSVTASNTEGSTEQTTDNEGAKLVVSEEKDQSSSVDTSTEDKRPDAVPDLCSTEKSAEGISGLTCEGHTEGQTDGKRKRNRRHKRKKTQQHSTDGTEVEISDKTAESDKLPKAGRTPGSAKAATKASKSPGSAKGQKTPRKKYLTLEDMVLSPSTSNSSAVRRLFDDSYEKPSGSSEGQQPSDQPGEMATVSEADQRIMDAIDDKFLLRTGKVVYIVETVHSRAFSGHVRPMQDKNPNLALFAPLDYRMPRLFVPMSDCPPDFVERPDDYANTLFICRLTEWPADSSFAKGTLARSLGEAGEIEPETEGMLTSYGIDYSEFPQEAIDCLPVAASDTNWTIPAEEFSYRRDLRQECVFTIDPSTARDLDDAVHCTLLPNGQYEVGVHIADVSYFLQSDNYLDKVARSRSTSVYLVQRVIPMLPRVLSEQLCSLNPDEDRLTFSVIWQMDLQGHITAEWFGRTVIRSCAKLSYDHAQGFIEDPSRQWTEAELPPISKGFTIPMIVERVLNLHKIASSLRQKRFDSGALRLDQVKLQYTLDAKTGLPCGYSVYRQRESNRLIEEFMLLANMAVARHIYRSFPEFAVLRRHPEPQVKMIRDLEMQCQHLGVALDCSNAGTIHQSIAAFAGDDLDSQAKQQILVVLCSKPMQNALYFCTGCLEDEAQYQHYALNVPLYTHFTSPIRRYPDIMVHRLLAASLGYSELPAWSKQQVQDQADHSNRKKYDSKKVQELSTDLFFSIFVKECGPLEESGMVMGVLDKAVDVLILKLGVVKRVYMEQLALESYQFSKEQKTPKLHVIWSADDKHPSKRAQYITIFTRVKCVLQADPKVPLKWGAVIKHPDEE